MKKIIVKFFLLSNLVVFEVVSMEKSAKFSGNKDSNQASAYYMALLAAELSTEQVEGFSGHFRLYKQDFFNVKQAFELYKKDSENICQNALEKTDITKKRITIEAFLIMVKEEHKSGVMKKLLYSAVSQGHEKSVEFLFEQNVDLGDAQEEFTLLELAFQNSDTGVASRLLEKTAGVPDTRKANKKWSLRGTWQSIIK